MNRVYRRIRKHLWELALGALLSLGVFTSWTGVRSCLQSGFSVDVCSIFGKTAWEWLELLIAPAVLAGFGILANQYFKQRDKREEELEKERTEKQREQERIIAKDKERQESLKDYLADMTELLLDDSWLVANAQTDSSVVSQIPRIVAIARARTITILRELDGERKGLVIKFLSESGSLKLISLAFSDLRGANLYQANLNGVNLEGTNLDGANLEGANLRRARLIRAMLFNVNLSKAYLNNANLCRANFSNANLIEANLSKANLHSTIFSDANLYLTNLEGIEWNDETKWPYNNGLAKARNVPAKLSNYPGSLLALPPASPT